LWVFFSPPGTPQKRAPFPRGGAPQAPNPPGGGKNPQSPGGFSPRFSPQKKGGGRDPPGRPSPLASTPPPWGKKRPGRPPPPKGPFFPQPPQTPGLGGKRGEKKKPGFFSLGVSWGTPAPNLFLRGGGFFPNLRKKKKPGGIGGARGVAPTFFFFKDFSGLGKGAGDFSGGGGGGGSGGGVP